MQFKNFLTVFSGFAKVYSFCNTYTKNKLKNGATATLLRTKASWLDEQMFKISRLNALSCLEIMIMDLALIQRAQLVYIDTYVINMYT